MNETSDRSFGASDDGRCGGGGAGEQSPLRARAAFFANWSWQSVTDLNRRLCERGGAQFGLNSESGSAAECEWEAARQQEISLAEALDGLRRYHRKAPFLFFNGNTFADIARALGGILFRELPTPRLRLTTSALAHYVAGVMDREVAIDLVESLCRAADLGVGDRVRTLKGSLHGVITEALSDGRVRWQADSELEFIASRDSLLPEDA